eukprot:TRINITY_DN1003_c0_g1_i1.p1 TRINITY_DN1003_c0_g1~~TRINITY_DN1003_c0_g1_i1.p1  ORF type:complete len:303 (+),score=75.76 TRINITY_DN1003_c0_g1_i1:226-1134(+)
MFFRANPSCGLKSNVFVSNTRTNQQRNFGDFLSFNDGFIQLKNTQQKILHLSDIKFYNNKGRNDGEVLSLIETMTERVKPDLVVITGDVIDKRFTGSGYKAFRNMIIPLVERKQAWTYLPGTGEGIKACTREELLNIFDMPYCASKGRSSFTHMLDVGPMQIYLVDSEEEDFTNEDNIQSINRVHWNRSSPFTKECGLAFLYNDKLPKTEDKIDREQLFELRSNSKWGKLVSENGKVWMHHGLFSGFSKPIEIATKERGGRVISFDSRHKILATWFETKQGIERETIISKTLTVEERTSLVD